MTVHPFRVPINGTNHLVALPWSPCSDRGDERPEELSKASGHGREDGRQHVNRHAALAALEAADVGPVNASALSKLLLRRDACSEAQLLEPRSDVPPERQVLLPGHGTAHYESSIQVATA